MPARTPPPTYPSTSAVMKANPAANTRPERRVRHLLREANFPGYRLHWKKAPGRPDIAYPSRRIAIFVHGCYWHRCPRCYTSLPKSHVEFWSRKFNENQERDRRNTAALFDLGWKVFVVWECELRDTPATALRPILECLAEAG